MASSTAGERRWASTRRGGMTVLGKVAVPKPINLPSQRLENHGLDPNVEIVPKGSLSWGNRSSSSGSNAWVSSSVLSPRTEGGSASPSHLSGRPSSGGGTRPSTAGSERTLDSTNNIWTSNSRPSSASGILASNKTSLTGLRPRSAENRPGNSQLSRFAEPSAEGTAAWGTFGAADKLGIRASPNEGFSLSSGDFPTLGSEKNSGKNMESLDHNSHGRPGSSSGRPSATTEKMEVAPGDDISRRIGVKSGLVNSWKHEGPQRVEDCPHAGMERWHGDPYPCPNPNIPPHPYEAWRGGAPVNPPGGVWYRGPPGAPYGPPPMAAPGGFPMEPFPYYRPQVPAPGLVNSQTVPPCGAGPHSKNGELCRPIMEPYMRPGMPIRPGFYPGYYGPPMSFCNPNERDFPFMGMAPGPPVYNRYPNQNAPESTNSNARSCEGRTLEQVESRHPHDCRRYHSVPVKQKKGWDKNVEDQFGHKIVTNAHPCDKGYGANCSFQENFGSESHRKDEQMNHGKMPIQSEETSSLLLEDDIGSSDPARVKFHGNTSGGEFSDVNSAIVNVALPKDHTLIQKIEGLNAKVWASDGRHTFCREESCGRGQVASSKSTHPINEANAGIHLERHYPSGILVPVSRDMPVLADDKGFSSTVSSVKGISRRSSRNLEGRGDHGGKDRRSSQEADGWCKRSATSESEDKVSVVNSGGTTNIQGKEQPPVVQSAEMSRSDGEMKDDSILSTFDPCDNQRAKMREMAKQRAIQLQKEEEERIREQKAKAFAKLEELNRRSANQGKETSRDKADNVPSHADVMQNQEESNIKIELRFGSNQSVQMGSTLSHSYSPSKANKALESNLSSGVIFLQTDQNMRQHDPVLSQKQSLPATDDANINDVADSQNVQVSESSRQKRAGYKQKNNAQSGKNLTEKPIQEAKENNGPILTVLNEVDGKGISLPSESILPIDLPTGSGSLMHPRRKNNRAGKNKHKVGESFAVSSGSLQESDASKSVTESMKPDTIESKLESLTIQPPVDTKDVGQTLEIHPSLPHDDVQYRGNNSWKSQHARKVPRNFQGRPTEKSCSNDVVWAPIKSHNRIEVTDDNSQKAEGAVPSTRSDNAVPSSSKSKRAEMERYVPKAAIKESAQQGSILLSASPSTEQSIPDGTGSGGQVTSQTIERTGRPVECRHMESKPKQRQNHGSWVQRVSAESNFVQVSGDRSPSTVNTSKKSQTFDELQQTQKPKELPKESAAKPLAQLAKVQPSKQDELPIKRQPQPGEVNTDMVIDGWNIVDEPVPSGIFSGVKDHGTSGRGKKNPFRGHKGSGNPQNFDRKNRNYAEVDADYYSETSQQDRPTSSKGKNVAHWQPKSQTHVTNQHGNGGREHQTVTSEGENGGSQLKQHNNQDTGKSKGQPQICSVPKSKDVSRMPNIRSQETVVESKAAPSEDRGYSPKDTVVESQSAPEGHYDGTNSERRLTSSGHSRNEKYNGRFNRSHHEFRGDQNFTEENRQKYAPANRQKQRQNSHSEYQPVGPYNTNRRGNNSEGQSENQHAGPRFRDRGPWTHSRHGGASFYGWQRGNNLI